LHPYCSRAHGKCCQRQHTHTQNNKFGNNVKVNGKIGHPLFLPNL